AIRDSVNGGVAKIEVFESHWGISPAASVGHVVVSHGEICNRHSRDLLSAMGKTIRSWKNCWKGYWRRREELEFLALDSNEL
ncbi:hypothetical protein, partial [Novosphingobium sp. Rr 2-17]|uniref:hypothetical protein n=1 Tax=Novosphingobium sp. Rr 2-17 TaxID=555793 RepID=UPI001ED92C5C